MYRSNLKSLLCATSAAGLLAGLAPPAWAQDQGVSSLTEVVVTAQKREEKLQEVPLSVAVIPAQALAAFKFNQATDIQYLVPGLTLTNSAGPRNFGFFVRGIGTSSFSSESIEGSTAFVLDGVVLGQSGASLTDLPDVDRVEVLRGPQGTLFGKNASAGVISVTTRRPSDTFGAELSASYADPDNERRVSGLITGPIGDQARFLISARVNERDGYVTNVFDGRKLNDEDNWGVRGKLELDPTSRLRVTLIGDYWSRQAHCCVWTLARTGPLPSAVELAERGAGIVPGPDNLKTDINGPVFADSQSYGGSAQADYDLGGDFTLTSITAWRRFLSHDGLDSDSSPFNVLDVNFANFKQSQVTQELRLTSPKGGFVDYVAGAFYFDGHVRSTSVQLFPTIPVPFVSDQVTNDASTSNIALFGQANLNFTSQFRGIFGARIVNERDEAQKDRFDPRFHLSSTAHASKTDDAAVWRAGLQYDLRPGAMVFATATRGYKGGGYDTNIGLATLPDVQPEKPLNYELGLRTSWPAQRLIVNLTAFDTDVKGYQAAARDAGPPPVTRIFNGEATTKGVEFDAAWRPLPGADWTLTASGAYVDARWGDFTNAPCFTGQTAAQGCVGARQNLSHARLPLSPVWSGNLSSHVETAVAGSLKASFDLGANSRSTALMAFPNDPSTAQKGYTLVNAAVGLASQDHRWKVSVFAKNLTDRRYSVVDFSTPFGGPVGSYSQFIPYEAQRVVGVGLDLAY